MLRGYITYQELKDNYNVSENTLKKSCSRYRKKEIRTWRNMKFQNSIWIDLDTIPQATRTKYNVPTADEYEILKWQKEEELKKLVKEQEADLNFKKIKEAIDGYAEYFNDYYSICEKKGLKGESLLTRARKYAIRHAFWTAVLEIAPYKKHPATMDCHRIGVELTKTEPLLAIKETASNFSSSIYNARKYGVKQAVSSCMVNENEEFSYGNQKFGDYEKGLVYFYSTRPERYSQVQVLRLVNYVLVQENRQIVSLSWVKTLRNSVEFKNSIERQSRGAKYNKDFNEPYLHRKTICANRVWQLDGTPSQTMCWDNGQWIRPYIFAVKDVFSKKILGVSISKSEDRHAIMTALQMAVELTGQLANEIVVDNASAFKTDEMKEIQLQMEKKGVYWRFAKPENAQDKSQIERFWSTFQGKYENMLVNYLGRGITTKAANRPSAFMIRQNLKQNKYSLNDMKLHLNELICFHNAEKVNDLSPNILYNVAENPDKIEIDEMARVVLFFNTTHVKMARCEVKVTYKNEKYFYSVPNEVACNYNGTRIKVKYDPFDMSKVWLFDEIDNCLCECKEIHAINQATIDRTDEDNTQMHKVEQKKKDYNNRMDNKHENFMNLVDSKELPTLYSTYKDELNNAETMQYIGLAGKFNDIDFSTVKELPQENSRTEFEKSDYDKTADLLSNKNKKKKP